MTHVDDDGPQFRAVRASPQTAHYTAVVCLVVQMVDGYILTPLVDRKSVELRPVVTIIGVS